MCGIVAIAGATGARGDLDAGIAALAHRGPDGRGAWRGDGIALGHTRLAVVGDAPQPIANEDGSIVAVVNGELYGWEDDARWLASRGHVLRAGSDSEVLVHLYEELGDDVVRRVRGELAFVLWDGRRRRLLAGRDRFGVKPLVWARFGDGIALASEAKALFALGVPARWDAESFFHAAHVQYTWPDRTLFAGVHQLEPAHVLVWDGEVRTARYWDVEPREGDVREVLATAVRERLRADAPICVQLSGGLDSSSVAALGASKIGAAFTVAFPGGEEPEAAATAHALGLPFHAVVVDGAAIAADWPAAVAHGEGLAINGHLVGKWRLSRAMRDAGFKVALTGEGADELFAGYAHLRRDAGVAADHARSHGLMLPAGDALPLDGVRARLGFVPTWLAAKATLGRRVRALLSPDVVDLGRGEDPYGALVDRLKLPAMTPLHASATMWMRTALASYILRTLGDGMEMAHGIEGRVPFLDHRVAEVAWAIDPAALVAGELDKGILRRAMAGIVPPAVLARGKQPFLAPPLAQLAPALVQDTLRTHARSSPLVDGARLVTILDALPAMTPDEQQAWDPALMLVLSAAILEARYCR